MNSLKDFIIKAVKYFSNPVALGLVALAISIFLFSISLTNFTFELRLVRRDLPKSLDRIDRQIADVDKLLKGAEKAGQSFQTGVNTGISKAVVDVPLGTVANVGYKLSDTAASTGTQTLGFWQGLKDRFFFWQKRSTPEASSKK